MLFSLVGYCSKHAQAYGRLEQPANAAAPIFQSATPLPQPTHAPSYVHPVSAGAVGSFGAVGSAPDSLFGHLTVNGNGQASGAAASMFSNLSVRPASVTMAAPVAQPSAAFDFIADEPPMTQQDDSSAFSFLS